MAASCFSIENSRSFASLASPGACRGDAQFCTFLIYWVLLLLDLCLLSAYGIFLFVFRFCYNLCREYVPWGYLHCPHTGLIIGAVFGLCQWYTDIYPRQLAIRVYRANLVFLGLHLHISQTCTLYVLDTNALSVCQYRRSVNRDNILKVS